MTNQNVLKLQIVQHNAPAISTVSALMTSGIGQFHTNEPDAEFPKPYRTIDLAGIRALVDFPQKLDKSKAQWLIPSSYPSRNFKEQAAHGKYWLLWADLDKNPPTLPDLEPHVESILNGYDFELYNTSSATADNQKARLLIPVQTPINGYEWVIMQEILNDKLEAQEFLNEDAEILNIITDRASERPAQLCYLPNKGAFYGSQSKREGKFFNPTQAWAQEIAAKRDAIEAQRVALEAAKKVTIARREALNVSDAGIKLWDFFNEIYTPHEWMTTYGYAQKGNSFRHPNSESGSYSCGVRISDSGVLRANALSPNDPLYVDGSKSGHSAFSVYTVLFHNNDRDAALIDAGDKLLTIDGVPYNEVWKANQNKQPKNTSKESNVIQLNKSGNDTAKTTSTYEIDTSSFKDDIFTQKDDDVLDIQPFPGPMAEIVESSLKLANKPQPELTNLAVLIGMASACNGQHILPGGGRLNLYGLGIAGTGFGKEHPRNTAEQVAEAGGCQVTGQPGSGAGLEDLLEPNNGLLLAIDEVAHLMDAINGSNKAPYLIDLSGNLLKLFSASKGTYRTRALAKTKGVESAKSIKHPCVNMIGFATPEKLGKAVGVGNIEDGLLGRMLFAMGHDGVAPRRGVDSFRLSNSILKIAQEINDANGGFSQEVRISISTEANSLLDSFMYEFDTNATQARTLFSRALKMRSFEKCERIAGVLAVWDAQQQPVISVEHVLWAARFVMQSDRTVTKFCTDFMHGGQVQADAALIIKTIVRVASGEIKPQKANESAHIKAGRLPRSIILKISRLAKKDFDNALDHLVDLGEIICTEANVRESNGREYKTKFLILL